MKVRDETNVLTYRRIGNCHHPDLPVIIIKIDDRIGKIEI